MTIQAAEFDDLLQVFLRLSELMVPQYDMRTEVEKWKLKFTSSQQRKGLEAALGDLAENGFHLTPAERHLIDNVMQSEGLMTLSELQVRHGKRVQRLLKRTKLANEDDAMALKGFVDAGLLNEQDTEIAISLIESFGA